MDKKKFIEKLNDFLEVFITVLLIMMCLGIKYNNVEGITKLIIAIITLLCV